MNPHAPTPPQHQGPVATSQPRSFWKGPGGLIALAVIIGGALAGVLYLGGMSPAGDPEGQPVRVTMIGCSADDFAAKAALTITNTGVRTRNATIDIEYRDGDGGRLDTDTAYVRDIAPGETVKHDETTILDAAPTGQVTCAITGVDSF